ncbi:hypothetical protein SLS60_007451 [Paraconiothyrium brasiliense]|uniref:RNase III domain-containing protein n=1 Tax=Paraconiothyrium brasiliense TaxID=300254 RepID=A0ABR3R5E1_9PLEO
MVRGFRPFVNRSRDPLQSHVTSTTPSTLKPAARLNTLEEREALKLGKRIEAIWATRRSLTIGEKNELTWLVTTQKHLRSGRLTLAQLQGLEPYRTWNVADQVRNLSHDQDETQLRRHLRIFNGDYTDLESQATAHQNVPTVSYRLPGSAWETQQARPQSPPQPVDDPSSKQSDPVEAPGPSFPLESPLVPERGQRISTSQDSRDPRAPQRVPGIRNIIEQRITSAKARLSRLLRGVSPFAQGSFHVRTDYARCPSNFFTRRDSLFFHMSQDPLHFHRPPPPIHIDLFDAATRDVRVENVIGYSFKNKSLCIEALKTDRTEIPLYWQGIVTPIADNRRLALLGDRALGLALAELWWDTNSSTYTYQALARKLESRVALALRGRELGIDDALIIRREHGPQVSDIIAETLEAIVGAVFVDSNNSLSVVQGVVKNLRFDHDLRQLAKAISPERGPTAVADNPLTNLPQIDFADDVPVTLSTEQLPAKTPNLEQASAERSHEQSQQIPEMFKKKSGIEQILAWKLPNDRRVHLLHELSKLQRQMEKVGATSVEYETFELKMSPQDRTTCMHAILVSEELFVKKLIEFRSNTRGRRKSLERQLDFVRQKIQSSSLEAGFKIDRATNEHEFSPLQVKSVKEKLLRKRWEYEMFTAMQGFSDYRIDKWKKLVDVKLQLDQIGVTPAEYDAYKSSMLAQDNIALTYYKEV